MIFLASSSPRRAELLRQIGVDFETLETSIDESQLPTESAEEYVCRMAETKARAGQKMASARARLLPVSKIIGQAASGAVGRGAQLCG